VIVIAGTPQEAVCAGGDDRQPPCGAFFITSALYNCNFHLISIGPVYDYRVLLTGFLLPRKFPVLN